MPNYKITQPVNWRRILRCVRKRIEADKYFLEGLQNRKANINVIKGKEYLCRDLQGNLETYQALRKFLGYPTPTKLEKETAELLKALLNVGNAEVNIPSRENG